MSRLAARGTVVLACGLALALLVAAGSVAWADAIDDEVDAIRAQIEARGDCWTAGRTSVMELPAAERAALRGLILPPGESGLLTPEEIESRPAPGTFRTYFSWRDQGMMTGVRNQGSCGSCWAHAPIAVLESYIKRVTGISQNLSEQQMVSCTSDGCGGGWMSTAYNLMRSYGCVDELCMPYEGSDAVPCTQTQCDVVDRIQGYYSTGGTVTQIKAALANGPVSCSMTAYEDFNGYDGGCYQNPGHNASNHAVTICGWDDAACSGAGAWECKNSWGTNWGEDGYFWIRYGSCNIGSSAQQVNYTPLYPVVIAHAPLRNTDQTGQGYLVRAEVFAYLANVAVARIRYRVNGGSYQPVTMTHAGGDTYEGTIPPQAIGAVVDYYLEAQDAGGRMGYHPKDGPPEHHTFRVVSFVTMDHCESLGSWRLSAVGDNATDGFWECGDPEGTTYNGYAVQSEDDTTPDGVACFVTGAAWQGHLINNDVDGGRTTLLSPTFDLSELDEAFLGFDLWYVNAAGYAPVGDQLTVDASANGGGTWSNVLTLSGEWFPGGWARYTFNLHEEIALTSQVLIRFVASDTGIENTVEALVDEFEISSPTPLFSAVPRDGIRPALELSAPRPNPLAGDARLAFHLARSGEIDLGAYSLDGRRQRTLLQGAATHGWHSLVWDGCDEHGRLLPAGIYYLQLCAPEGVRTSRVVVVR